MPPSIYPTAIGSKLCPTHTPTHLLELELELVEGAVLVTAGCDGVFDPVATCCTTVVNRLRALFKACKLAGEDPDAMKIKS